MNSVDYQIRNLEVLQNEGQMFSICLTFRAFLGQCSKAKNSTFLFRNTFIPTRDNSRVQFFDTHKFDLWCLKNLKRSVSSESAHDTTANVSRLKNNPSHAL